MLGKMQAGCRKCDAYVAEKDSKETGIACTEKYLIRSSIGHIMVDVLRPLPDTEAGNQYFLIAINYFTKWSESCAVRNKESVIVAGC